MAWAPCRSGLPVAWACLPPGPPVAWASLPPGFPATCAKTNVFIGIVGKEILDFQRDLLRFLFKFSSISGAALGCSGAALGLLWAALLWAALERFVAALGCAELLWAEIAFRKDPIWIFTTMVRVAVDNLEMQQKCTLTN